MIARSRVLICLKVGVHGKGTLYQTWHHRSGDSIKRSRVVHPFNLYYYYYYKGSYAELSQSLSELGMRFFGHVVKIC